MITDKNNMTLAGLSKGSRALIKRVSGETAMAQRLMEMGLLEGSWVELVHEAPFGGDPIAVRVRGALIALRRNEASLIEVSV